MTPCVRQVRQWLFAVKVKVQSLVGYVVVAGFLLQALFCQYDLQYSAFYYRPNHPARYCSFGHPLGVSPVIQIMEVTVI
jgi:hypothetical protein